MNILENKIEFQVMDALTLPNDSDDCFWINVVKGFVQETFEAFKIHWKHVQSKAKDDDHESPISQWHALLNAAPYVKERWRPTYEPLSLSHSKLVPSIEDSPILELKPFPDHLKYVCLGDFDTFPVVIASDLSEDEERKLSRVQREHKTTIAWTIADIKGISPTMFMRRILMEDNFKLTRENQRRLNLNMKEVVHKEVL